MRRTQADTASDNPTIKRRCQPLIKQRLGNAMRQLMEAPCCWGQRRALPAALLKAAIRWPTVRCPAPGQAHLSEGHAASVVVKPGERVVRVAGHREVGAAPQLAGLWVERHQVGHAACREVEVGGGGQHRVGSGAGRGGVGWEGLDYGATSVVVRVPSRRQSRRLRGKGAGQPLQKGGSTSGAARCALPRSCWPHSTRPSWLCRKRTPRRLALPAPTSGCTSS